MDSLAPRGFYPEEKEQIKDELLKVGREKFATFGLKKTSIKDLTESVGIAQGSFYTFFDSKELLFFQILEQDEQEIQEELKIQFTQVKEMNAKAFTEIILKALSLMDQYPLVKRMFIKTEFEELLRKLPQELFEENMKKDTLNFAPLFQKWSKDGIVDKAISPEVLTASLRAITLMVFHKQEIGEDVFDHSMALLIESLANRIFAKGE